MPRKRIEFEPEIEEYLNLKSPITARTYSAGFAKFLEYYRGKYGEDANFQHFLGRIFEEFKKPPLEQKRIVDTEVSGFIKFLQKKKLSNNSIRLYFAAIQNYLKFKRVVITAGFIKLPNSIEKKGNGKHEWQINQIKQFVETATNYRDKALILCMFQSGLGVKEICNLNYGDVQDELEAGVLPICLKLVRQKTGVQFKTFFGRDAVKYLKLYLETRGKLKFGDPLFTKHRIRGGEERINTTTIEQTFSELSKKLPFIKQKEKSYNPARPHSLRAAFKSRLFTINETLSEFWMGHSIGTVSRAYLTMPTEEMRKLYMSAEEFLKIERSSRDELDETTKSKDMATMILEGNVKELEQGIKAQEQRVKMHEKIFKQMTEMSFEEFAKWMQDKNRWEWQQQREADIHTTKKVRVIENE